MHADYLLGVRDAQAVPTENRADLAMLVREGHLSVYPDATLRPRIHSIARVLHAIARCSRPAICCNFRKQTRARQPMGK